MKVRTFLITLSIRKIRIQKFQVSSFYEKQCNLGDHEYKKIKLQKIVGNLLDKLRKLYMNGTSIQKFLTGSTWCKTAQKVPSNRPPLLVLQKILGNISFSEQIFYRKQSLGAPVHITVLNSPNAPLYLHQAMQTQRTCTVCGPWSAQVRNALGPRLFRK